jgi:hypothetical protein
MRWWLDNPVLMSICMWDRCTAEKKNKMGAQWKGVWLPTCCTWCGSMSIRSSGCGTCGGGGRLRWWWHISLRLTLLVLCLQDVAWICAWPCYCCCVWCALWLACWGDAQQRKSTRWDSNCMSCECAGFACGVIVAGVWGVLEVEESEGWFCDYDTLTWLCDWFCCCCAHFTLSCSGWQATNNGCQKIAELWQLVEYGKKNILFCHILQGLWQ